jgi:hypothetical protein
MRTRRDILLIGGLFLILILFVVFGPASQPTQQPGGPKSHSSGQGGALALYTWLEQIGYRPERLEFRDYALDGDVDLLMILGPTNEITPDQARHTLEWVQGGGTLVLATEQSALFGSGNALLDQLDVELAVYTPTTVIEHATPLQPALDSPPVTRPLVQASRILLPRRADYTALLGASDALVSLGVRHGQGYVYLFSTVYPFTNDGLADEQNARLVLNALRRVPAGGRVLFDEYHHGYIRPPTAATPITGNPIGWTGLYVAMAVGMYLLLSGRRFGRPVPLAEEVQRRTSAEYVESMADLFQRGGKTAYIGAHYHTQFKRQVARPYGVNPQLDDDTFASEVARVAGFEGQEESALRAVLQQLGRPPDDAALLRAIGNADAFVARRRAGH